MHRAMHIRVWELTPTARPAQRLPRPIIDRTEPVTEFPNDAQVIEQIGAITADQRYGTTRYVQCHRTNGQGTREWLTAITMFEQSTK